VSGAACRVFYQPKVFRRPRLVTFGPAVPDRVIARNSSFRRPSHAGIVQVGHFFRDPGGCRLLFIHKTLAKDERSEEENKFIIDSNRGINSIRGDHVTHPHIISSLLSFVCMCVFSLPLISQSSSSHFLSARDNRTSVSDRFFLLSATCSRTPLLFQY